MTARNPYGKARLELRSFGAGAFRFQSGAHVISLRHNMHVCRDPKDNMFLECASLARADVLVTGDKDLLCLGSYADSQIMTPAQYVALPL